MGLIIDPGVFIKAERQGQLEPSKVIPRTDEAALCSISLSVLLEGIHYANSSQRAQRRQDFVELVKAIIPVLAFDESIVVVHAQLRSTQRKLGRMIGAHDLIIAATAMSLGWDVLTFNAAEFRQVEGLGIREA